jgi:pyroglutamyl-peptidase
MRILIYGFGPYRQFRNNITEKIVRALPRRSGLKKIVFPVRFHKSQFIEAVKRFSPDIVLGLGQCSRGRILRLETRAANQWRNSKLDKPKPTVPGGPPKLSTNLKLKLARRARVSNDAGDYVCNYSMYVMLDYIKRRRLPVLYGFIHVPRVYDPKIALRVLRQAIIGSKFKAQGSAMKKAVGVSQLQQFPKPSPFGRGKGEGT